MRWQDVAAYWNDNADAWTELARAGSDVCRDHLNAPAFFGMMPPIKGLHGLDVGCGEGYNTRMAAGLGAKITAIDVAEKFISYAIKEEETNPLGINYQIASATDLPFKDETFDFVMATMSLMDIAETEVALKEAFRVCKRGGFFQFSICHPCFQTRRFEWVEKEGVPVGVICGDYWDTRDGIIEEWSFSNAPPELQGKWADFKVPRFDRTLSEWVNTLIDCGFTIRRMGEPRPAAEIALQYPGLEKYRLIALFLHILCGKT
jgi:ubiquinone/menaquinone biosynthesis C-methylase UbiE